MPGRRLALRRAVLLAAAAFAASVAVAPAEAAQVKRFSSPSVSVSTARTATKPADLLRRTERAFRTSARTGERRDISPLLHRLALALPRLKGAERRRAARLLARPTDGASDPQGSGWTAPEAPGSPLCTANYCIHWVATGPDAPDLTDSDLDGVPDYVEQVSDVSEHVHTVENGQLGWQEAKSDGTRGGGNGLTDVYLSDLGGSGIYGYAAADPGQHLTDNDHSAFSYLVLDDDYATSEFPGYASSLEPLEVTMAHEYNHVLQYSYDAVQDTWMLESTAVWMEGKVYEPVHDYLQYLTGWVQLSRQPITAFNGIDPNDRTNLKVYGSAVWNKWLDAGFGQDVVRNAWESSTSSTPQSYAPAAYDAAIKKQGGAGFTDQFDRFVTATAEWQASDSGFPEGALYPDVERVGRLRVNGAAGLLTLDHTAYALFDVTPTSAARIKLAMKSPKGTAAALALVGRTGGSPGGTTTQVLRELPNGGAATVVLPASEGFDRLTAVLVNSDIKVTGYSDALADWVFPKDGQRFYTHVSTDFTAPRVRSRVPAPRRHVSKRQRVTVGFDEPVLGVTGKTFQLLSRGRAVPAAIKFTVGARKATLVPRRGLRSGKRYSVRLTNAITDLSLNRLKRPRSWRFTAR
jgi:hypothetical protein